MEAFYEKEEATTRSKIITIKTGEAPSVTLVDYVAGPQGTKRHFVQQVPVNDARLLKRLLVEAEEGDEIEATIVNECRETGCITYLADFKKADGLRPKGIVENGAVPLVRDEITEIVMTPDKTTQTKVRH